MPDEPRQPETHTSSARDSLRSCGGCALVLACILLPPMAMPIYGRIHERLVGPCLWLALCVVLLLLWLRLADSAMHGLAWGGLYVTIVLMLGAQILMALAMLLGHAFA